MTATLSHPETGRKAETATRPEVAAFGGFTVARVTAQKFTVDMSKGAMKLLRARAHASGASLAEQFTAALSGMLKPQADLDRVAAETPGAPAPSTAEFDKGMAFATICGALDDAAETCLEDVLATLDGLSSLMAGNPQLREARDRMSAIVVAEGDLNTLSGEFLYAMVTEQPAGSKGSIERALYAVARLYESMRNLPTQQALHVCKGCLALCEADDRLGQYAPAFRALLDIPAFIRDTEEAWEASC